MMHDQVALHRRSGLTRRLLGAVELLERIPYAALAMVLRLAVAQVFWGSAMVKLASWSSTLFLFRDEYKVPVLPPEIAAYTATAVEISMPILLVLGLGTRVAAGVLLGMTLVIQLFVYPEAWPTHIQWAAMLLVLFARGGGALSLDRLVAGRFAPGPRARGFR